jgi:ADP-heptose:LPS heptosyltransferase
LVARGEDVEVLTSSRFAPLFEGMGLPRLWTPEEIDQAGSFDSVIDLQANGTSRRLLHGHGKGQRNRGRGLARRFLVFWGRRAPWMHLPHAVQRYAEAAACEVEDPHELRPRVAVTERDIEEAQALPGAWARTESACIALAEGASRRMKRWPAARFAELAAGLAQNGWESLRLLEPANGPHENGAAVHAPLRALKGLLSRCSLLVTNDSGVMHLAVGLDVPVVAIFGSTTRDFGFGPLGERDRVVERDLACRPCAVHGARFCWQGHERCLREVGVRDVLDAVLEGTGQRKKGTQ